MIAEAGDVIDLIIVVTLGLTCVIPMLNVNVSIRSQQAGAMNAKGEVCDKLKGLCCLSMYCIAHKQATDSSPMNPTIV